MQHLSLFCVGSAKLLKQSLLHPLCHMIVCHPFEPLAARQVNPILFTGGLQVCQ